MAPQEAQGQTLTKEGGLCPNLLHIVRIFFAALLLFFCLQPEALSAQWKRRAAAINTLVGTDQNETRSAGYYGKGSEEHGQTLPAVLMPHGMNFWTAQTRATEKKCVAPYYYPDTLWQGFRASHWIVGGCTQDYGSFTLMPMMGKLRLTEGERATRFHHEDEVAHPYYYAIRLPDEQLTAEMTATTRGAIFRFTPENNGTMHIVVCPNSDYGEGFVAVDTARCLIYGYNPVHRLYQGWGERTGFSGWFVVEYPREMMGQVHVYGVKHENGNPYAYVSFHVRKGEPAILKAATSFTGLDGALDNLKAELPTWNFRAICKKLQQAWCRQLSTIDIEDDDEDKVNAFYGALYRASFLPRVMSDVDGAHPAFASGKSVKAEDDRAVSATCSGKEVARPYYDDFSMWDIYRAQLPLLTLIEPVRMADIVQSLVTKYEEGGWMPVFPCWNSYTAAMIGDHAAAAIADAWVKGIRGFDVEKAYEGIRKNAFESPATFAEYRNGMGRRALKSYLRYGYIPLEDSVKEAFHTKEQVSRTLEYAYDDFCAAQLAKAVGQEQDYQELMRRSDNWKNVINPVTGWADARHEPRHNNGDSDLPDGKAGPFLGNTDLTRRLPFITEGSVMHYSFYVPHDVEGLATAMGGRKRLVEKLDTLFNGGYYWHGNEPCHHIPYLYALVGQPWKTVALVKDILANEYLDTPGGLSGNDDAGQMSAWYVFSSLGFYPVCPGKPEYVIGTPSFKKARIGRLVIEAENLSEANIYIQQTLWNGRPYLSPVITHDMITHGGHLKFIMGNSH